MACGKYIFFASPVVCCSGVREVGLIKGRFHGSKKKSEMRKVILKGWGGRKLDMG